MNQQSHLRPVEPTDGGDAPGGTRQAARQRASKALPTDRMKMDRQIAVLGALGRLSGPRKDAVDGDQLSKAVGGAVAATIILSNRFFADAGWITLSGRGRYSATDELVEYTRRLATGSRENAVEVLQAPVRQSWFWQVLEPYLTVGRVPVNEAVILLMREAGAMDHHLTMIQNLIAWLEYIGLVEVRGDSLVSLDGKADEAPAPVDSTAAEGSRGPDQEAPARTGAELVAPEPAVQGGGFPATPVVMFSLDVRLTVDDLAQLDADQIKAFFEAVGTLAAVKNRG